MGFTQGQLNAILATKTLIHIPKGQGRDFCDGVKIENGGSKDIDVLIIEHYDR